MEIARITKNGRADYFVIRTEKPEEWELLRPYYLQTSYDKPRAGRILEMACLFSDSVWCVRLSRSYAGTADVFRALVDWRSNSTAAGFLLPPWKSLTAQTPVATGSRCPIRHCRSWRRSTPPSSPAVVKRAGRSDPA